MSVALARLELVLTAGIFLQRHRPRQVEATERALVGVRETIARDRSVRNKASGARQANRFDRVRRIWRG